MEHNTSPLLLFLAIVSLGGQAQELAIVPPEKCGLASEKLKVIDKVLGDYVSQREIPGVVALVARKGKIGYLKSFGMRDIANNQPMTTDSYFRIASMTKAVTIVATMILFEEGHFELDAPISRFIPEFSDMQVLVLDSGETSYHLEKARTPISIRHLLNHTSGLTYDIFGQKILFDMYKKNDIYAGIGATTGTVAEMIQRLAKLPLANHPGEKYQYGLNMEVLGILIEKISGKDLGTFFKERIFDPLQMNDTYFFLPDNKINRLAKLYRYTKTGLIEVSGTTIEDHSTFSDYQTYATNKTYFAGGAGLVSTAMDYYKFLQMLLGNGKYNNKRILGRKTVELMTSQQTGNLFNWYQGYGSGFAFAISRGPENTGRPGSTGEYMWLGFFGTRFWVDPHENMIGIILYQCRTGEVDIHGRVKDLAYIAIDD